MGKVLSKAEILSKFGPKFATNSEKSPVLQGIHYANDGVAIVTNRFYLLRIHDVHKFEKPITLHAKTGQLVEGVYPDTSRTFPTNFAGEVTVLQSTMPDVLLAAQIAAGVASKLNKQTPVVQLVVENSSAYLDVTSEVRFPIGLSTRISERAPRENSKRILNAEYLLTATSVFDAAGTGFSIQLNGPHEPIVLTNYAGIDVLILPFRMNQ